MTQFEGKRMLTYGENKNILNSSAHRANFIHCALEAKTPVWLTGVATTALALNERTCFNE